MARGARSTPSAWFPEGRNPWTDLYTREFLDELRSLLSLDDDSCSDRLARDLCLVAERYVTLQDETALERRAAERAEWIETNIIAAASQLQQALDLQNSRIWSRWPSPGLDWPDSSADLRAPRDVSFTREHGRLRAARSAERESQRRRLRREVIRDYLQELEVWARQRVEELKVKGAGTHKPKTALKFNLVYDLVLLYKMHFPARPLYAKSYDGTTGTELVEFVRTSAQPVLGSKERLTAQIKSAKVRLSQRENFDPSWELYFF